MPAVESGLVESLNSMQTAISAAASNASHSSVRVDSRAHHALTRAIISITHKASVSGDEPVSLFRRICGLEFVD